MKPGAREIKLRKIADLIPYARNPRTHSEFQIKQIAESMKQFGFTNPILLDGKNNIIAGHGRVAAAELLELKEIPCIDLKEMSKAEQQAYVIADNQLALAAGWDLAMLAEEIQEIAQSGFDVSLLGFSEAEMANIEAIGANLDNKEHWQGMPEFIQPDASAFRAIIINFLNQEDVDTFAEKLGIKLTPDTRSTWFPQQEPFHAVDYTFKEKTE